MKQNIILEEKRKQMFNFFKTKKEQQKTDSDVVLEKIKSIMFPQINTHTDKEGNKYHIDYSVDINLDSVLTDLEEGYNDEASQNTIRKVSQRLYEIRKLLNIQQELDEDAKYVLADDLSETEK